MAIHKTTRKGFFDRMCDTVARHSNAIGITFGLLIVSAAMLFGYTLWMNKKNASAQLYFGTLVMEYNQSLYDKDADIDALLTKFEKGYESNAHASVLPYYKNYAVQLLLQQKKQPQALALLEEILKETQSSPMLPLYQMEQALIWLDSSGSEMKKQGEDLLLQLAQDTQNQFRDSAQFYMGRYYWVNDQIASARDIWQTLVNEQVDARVAPSPWAQQVKEYLALTIV